MKWGRQWGNLWGRDWISDIRITDLEQLPPAALVQWSPLAEGVIYHVYVDGLFYATTTGTELVVQFTSTGRHWIDIVAATTISEDVSSQISSVPGTRAKLAWTASPAADLDHYKIYWDQGLGGGMSYLGRTQGEETSWISAILSDGTYVFRVDPVDHAGNQLTSSLTASVVIARYPNPPSGLTLDSYDENTGIATFSFVESDTLGITGYKIYHNNGAGEWINYNTQRGTVAAGNTSVQIALSAGEWLVGLRSYNATYTEDNVDVFAKFELGGSPVDLLDDQPNVPTALVAVPAASGYFTLRCNYDAFEELANATTVRFYSDDGLGGAINYNSPVATGNIQLHTTGSNLVYPVEATTTSTFVDGRTYTFACKARTAGGRESDASETATATADATAPGDISALAGTAVNYEEE